MATITFQIHKWGQLCDALYVSPDTAIDTVIRKARRLAELRKEDGKTIHVLHAAARRVLEDSGYASFTAYEPFDGTWIVGNDALAALAALLPAEGGENV